MTATVVAALTTPGLLGVTHAVEPDHVAGISSLTSEYADARLSALVSACFSLGHVALVVAATLFPDYGGGVVALAVLTYGVAIAALAGSLLLDGVAVLA